MGWRASERETFVSNSRRPQRPQRRRRPQRQQAGRRATHGAGHRSASRRFWWWHHQILLTLERRAACAGGGQYTAPSDWLAGWLAGRTTVHHTHLCPLSIVGAKNAGVGKFVHLWRPNCTHSTSLLLVSWWSCLIHLVLLLWKTAADILALTAKRTSWNTLQKFMFKRNLWPCTRLFCNTLCTYRIIVSFLFYSVFVFQRMYFVYACSTSVLVNKDWY